MCERFIVHTSKATWSWDPFRPSIKAAPSAGKLWPVLALTQHRASRCATAPPSAVPCDCTVITQYLDITGLSRDLDR